MQLKSYTFLIILILVFIVPLFYIISGKYDFRKKLRYGIPAILISGFIFLLWDIRFTEVGVWSYDADYTLGISQKGLPLEQWLFYLVFSCTSLLVYEAIKTRFRTLDLNNIFVAIGLLMVIVFAIIAYMYRVRVYTFFCFLFTAVYFGYTIFRNQFKSCLTHFFLSYLVMLVPYFLLNGILTWNMAIEYHQEQVLNVWILMMPVENLVFLFLLLLINTTVYEYLSEHRFF